MSKLTSKHLQVMAIMLSACLTRANEDIVDAKAELKAEIDKTRNDPNVKKLTKQEKNLLKNLRRSRAVVATLTDIQRAVKISMKSEFPKTNRKSKKHGKDDARYLSWADKEVNAMPFVGD